MGMFRLSWKHSYIDIAGCNVETNLPTMKGHVPDKKYVNEKLVFLAIVNIKHNFLWWGLQKQIASPFQSSTFY